MAGGREKGLLMLRLAPRLVVHLLFMLVKMHGSPSSVCQPYQWVVLANTFDLMSEGKQVLLEGHLLPGRAAHHDAGVVEVGALLILAVAELHKVKAPTR